MCYHDEKYNYYSSTKLCTHCHRFGLLNTLSNIGFVKFGRSSTKDSLISKGQYELLFEAPAVVGDAATAIMRRGIPLGPVQHLLKGLPSYIPSSRRSEASSRLVDVGQPQIHVAAS